MRCASDVLKGDTGGNGNSLAALIDTLPVNGTLTFFNADGLFESAPCAGVFGADTFPRTVSTTAPWRVENHAQPDRPRAARRHEGAA